MHDGQICLPYPGGKIRLAHPRRRYTHGTYRRGGTIMHVSPGLGTTFLPVPLLRAAGGDRARAAPRLPRLAAVAPRVSGLTGATLVTAPSVCQGCVWWQSRAGREADKDRWRERIEEEWGAWGTLYYDDDGRLLGSMQYGPAELFPRAADLPAGPPSRRRAARHLRLPRRPLDAVGDAVALPGRDRRRARQGRARGRGVRLPLPGGDVDARALHPSTGRSSRTTSSRTSASRSCARQGLVELARLELGGLVPVLEGKRAGVLRVLREIFSPQPVPAPRP